MALAPTIHGSTATPAFPPAGVAAQPLPAPPPTQVDPRPTSLEASSDVRGDAVRSGLLAALPVLAGVAPFGLVIGVAVSETTVHNGAGWAGSFLILAGSAHLAAITLLGSGAGALAVLITVLVINARLLIYSASLGPHFRKQPRWFRWIAPYFLVDQIFAMTWNRIEAGASAEWVRWYYLSAAALISVVWLAVIAVGVVAGPVIPQSWELSFATPALLLALLAPALVNRPAWIAAAVGAAVAVLLIGMPHGLHLLIGAAAGTAAGIVSERIAR